MTFINLVVILSNNAAIQGNNSVIPHLMRNPLFLLENLKGGA
ncbi:MULTISPECIES: hypothetical protein [unclassified Oleiphilus]|nr:MULTISPECIES: hypothetical protein [unclassified Oleiphilus]